MTTTISLNDETKQRFDEARPDRADSNDEFVNLLLNVYDGEFEYEQEALFERFSAVEDVLGSNNIQREEYREVLEDMGERLDRIESAAKEATNAAQNAERAAEELQR